MEVTLLLAAGGVAAGLFGALLGLGGGILIVPLLTLGFGLPVRDAVGVSLVSVIVTSGAAAGVYLQRHLANVRLGVVLELFTAGGALLGGLTAFLLPQQALAGLFALLLLYTAAAMVRGRGERVGGDALPGALLSKADRRPAEGPTQAAPPVEAGPPAAERAAGSPETFIERLGGEGYRVRRLPAGMAGSFVAGILSALLGIGGGIVKVPLMNLTMGLPLHVAAATSNLMIGVTASASAVVYLLRGGIDPFVAGPTALGVFVGASAGSLTAQRIEGRWLRLLFVVVLLVTAVQMARRAIAPVP